MGASTTNCVAVGVASSDAADRAITDPWNRKHWTTSVSTTDSSTATPCPVPRARPAFVVGSRNFRQDLAQQWNETKSTVVAQPNVRGVKSVLVDISCLSTTKGYAAGSNTIEPWNGTSWSIGTHANA